MEARNKTFGQMGIIAMDGCEELGARVNKLIIERRKNDTDFDHYCNDQPETYILPIKQIRFSNGEGKVKLLDTARGKDLYIICDISNYSVTYNMFGFTNHMAPDEHFQDVKRLLSAIDGKSRRITLIMPLLYASRQDKRRSRESLDCAMALQELVRNGVNDILTFDVHNTAVQNAIPLVSFENLHASNDIIDALKEDEPDIFEGNPNLLVVSPDTSGMERAIYYGSMLGVDVGLFYKRRDHKTIVGGKNPIVDHVYIGNPVSGKDILIVDDMLSSGDSVYDLVDELKKRNASRIYAATTFTLFTEGIDRMREYYDSGMLSRMYSTNLGYIPDQVKTAPWFRMVDMSDYIAKLIDNLNYDRSLAPILNPNKV